MRVEENRDLTNQLYFSIVTRHCIHCKGVLVKRGEIMNISSGVALFLLICFAIYAIPGCSEEHHPITPERIKQIEKNADKMFTKTEIYLSDQEGNRLSRQSATVNEKAWVSGSFRYHGKKSEISPSIIIRIYNQSMKQKVGRGSYAGGLAKVVMDENSEKVKFFAKIDAPTSTGNFFITAEFLGIDFVESKITVVKKSKK